jgi:hypothetical protein
MYAYVKEVFYTRAKPRFDTFHQLLIIAEALWSQPVLQVSKQVVVAQSEIRAVRRVVKQLPAAPAAVCRNRMSCRSTTLDLSIPGLLF